MNRITFTLNKANIESAFLFWGLIFTLKPGYIYENIVLNNIFRVGVVMSLIIALFLSVKYWKIIYDKEIVFLLMIKGITIIFTIFNKGDLRELIYSTVTLWLECVLLVYCLKKKKDGLIILNGVYAVIVYINFFCMLIFPKGLYNFGGERVYTFVGHANSVIMFTFPLMVISLLCIERGVYKNLSKMNLLVVLLSTFLIGSATGLVVYSVFLICVVGLRFKNSVYSHLLFKFYLLVLVVIVGIVFFKIQHYFGFLIKSILQRKADFTGREYYWKLTIDAIMKKPLGHGYVEGVHRVGGLGSHNYLLEALYEGGVFMLALYTQWVYMVSKKINVMRNNNMGKFVLAAMISLILIGITESVIVDSNWFVVFVIALCLKSSRIRNE